MKAVIIKKIPIREYNELVVCYTQEAGKQAYQAKSILRPTSKQAGHLDVLNLVDFNLVLGNGHPIITSAYCLDAFSLLKSSLGATSVAFFILELFDKAVLEGQSDDKLWDFMGSRLSRLNELASLDNINWQNELAQVRKSAMETMGYGVNADPEFVFGRRFKSLAGINTLTIS